MLANEKLMMFFAVVAIAIAFIVAMFLRAPLLYVFQKIIFPFSKSRMERRALAQRADGHQVRVRQTDIESGMTGRDRSAHRQAEELVRIGRIVEAAQIFESIRFQRRAIDILEAHGFIDQAAEILMRLNAPHRVAVIYERNKMFQKSAHFFSLSGQHEKAGDMYQELAKSNYQFLKNATEEYVEAKANPKLLRVYAAMLETDKIVEKCFELNELDFLLGYLREPFVARKVLEDFTDEQVDKLISHVSLTPQIVQTFLSWLWLYPKTKTAVAIFDKVRTNRDLCEFFWRICDERLHKRLVEIISNQRDLINAATILAHAEALIRLERLESGLFILKATNMHKKLVEVLLEQRDVTRLHEFFIEVQETELANQCATILAEQPEGPWNAAVINQLRESTTLIQDIGEKVQTLSEEPIPDSIPFDPSA